MCWQGRRPVDHPGQPALWKPAADLLSKIQGQQTSKENMPGVANSGYSALNPKPEPLDPDASTL